MEGFNWKQKTEEQVQKLRESAHKARQQMAQLAEFATKSEGAAEALTYLLQEEQKASEEVSTPETPTA